jgi:hypothetical protein
MVNNYRYDQVALTLQITAAPIRMIAFTFMIRWEATL